MDCATQALEKYNIEKDIAAYIKREFDKVRTLPFELMCGNRQEVDSLNPPTEI